MAEGKEPDAVPEDIARAIGLICAILLTMNTDVAKQGSLSAGYVKQWAATLATYIATGK